MNFRHLILLLALIPVLTACPTKNYVHKDIKKLQDDHMNFTDLHRIYFDDIQFDFPKMFEEDYNDNYTLQDDQFTQVNHNLNIRFSCEHFYAEDAAAYQFLFDDSVQRMDAVHDYYVARRVKSLKDPKVSVKKPVPEHVPFKGFIQTVEGRTYNYSIPNTYCIATLEVDGDYYVFQFIAKNTNMVYLQDDFRRMLESVEIYY